MFKRLLIPLDGTPEAAAALPLARILGSALGASLRLVRVVPREQGDRGHTEEATAYLESIRAELREEAALVVHGAVRAGNPAEEIAREVRHGGADLVVMATHGRAGLDRVMHNSVAWRTLIASPVPVLLVRPGGHVTSCVKTLLVTLDGSPGGAIALGAAAGLARESGARLVLLQVVVPTPLSAYGADGGLGMGSYPDPAWDEEARAAAEVYVEALATRLRGTSLTAEGRALLGPLVDTIQEVADQVDADLVVMSTHAHAGPIHAVLGSTAEAVVRRAKRPVLLVRQTVERAEGSARPNPPALAVAV